MLDDILTLFICQLVSAMKKHQWLTSDVLSYIKMTFTYNKFQEYLPNIHKCIHMTPTQHCVLAQTQTESGLLWPQSCNTQKAKASGSPGVYYQSQGRGRELSRETNICRATLNENSYANAFITKWSSDDSCILWNIKVWNLPTWPSAITLALITPWESQSTIICGNC